MQYKRNPFLFFMPGVWMTCGKMNVHSADTFESVPMKKKPCQPNQADPAPCIRLKPEHQHGTQQHPQSVQSVHIVFRCLYGHCII